MVVSILAVAWILFIVAFVVGWSRVHASPGWLSASDMAERDDLPRTTRNAA